MSEMREQLAVPTHVAVIMDGNGRWAKSRGLPRVAGHKAGADSVRKVVEEASRLGIRYLTLYSFSSENWKRPETEVNDLMGLLRRYLKSEIAELHSKNIRFRVIGDRSRLSKDIVRLIDDAEALTDSNGGLCLVLALSYGSRAEITGAVRSISKMVAAGELSADDITEETVSAALYTSDIPDPDLLIRTSGEYRVSNFLMWQLAYTEFYFTDKFWPAFDGSDLVEAVKDFNKRDRRYGAVAHSC
ncbi:isoprenyl transferase [Aestuariispira insulae]|uniref:Isoprenyl transferase n=1 Tax=Aestuariispira insulae TaxID=1461337 RepID=A0A3D9HUX9_9PROT|nr:isoprenyl transferase [Aestuariispira insulae]RED53298.1 undecaprenyl pyrophosphate synthetase [Aestuariispira insulae]